MRLRCTQGPLLGEKIELHENVVFVLGREPGEGDYESFLLDSKSVSRKHCEIRFEKGRCRIKDLKSSNGLRLNRQKVLDGYLKQGDVLQIGEFTFQVEVDELEIQEEPTPLHTQKSSRSRGSVTTNPPATQSRKESLVALKDRAQEASLRLWTKFNRLDLLVRMAIVLGFSALISNWILSFALIQEARQKLIDQSVDLGFQAIKILVDRNRNSLAADSSISLDCSSVRDVPGVQKAFVISRDGATLCPVGGASFEDGLFEAVKERKETLTNGCLDRLLNQGLNSCEIMGPVFDWDQTKLSPQVVGYVRLEFSPERAFAALQNLQGLGTKTLIFSLLLMAAVWWILRLWLHKGVSSAAENVHVVTTGSSQRVERIEFFANLDPLIEEINQLIAKSIQGVASSSATAESEASFLQTLLQQILLLEERAVLVVDHENQFVAASTALSTMIPIDVSQDKAHIADIVADTHLQGELVSFLNDLSSSDSVMDRALSMSDRVLQVRGMPLFLKNQHVANLLLF
jgi:pSer/pThr/pTyr-binding forkhead associated (FHA) protein